MVAAVMGLSETDANYWWKVFSELDVPEGLRVELIEGEIVVSPPPHPYHEHDGSEVSAQVVRSAAADLRVGTTAGMSTPRGLFIPDGVVVPKGLFREKDDAWQSSEGVLMVVEVTSTRPATDRETKRLGYAEAEIPLYLLIDRQRKEVVLFSQPGDGDYRADVRVPFGSPLDLPAPLSFTLDTSDFV